MYSVAFVHKAKGFKIDEFCEEWKLTLWSIVGICPKDWMLNKFLSSRIVSNFYERPFMIECWKI